MYVCVWRWRWWWSGRWEGAVGSRHRRPVMRKAFPFIDASYAEDIPDNIFDDVSVPYSQTVIMSAISIPDKTTLSSHNALKPHDWLLKHLPRLRASIICKHDTRTFGNLWDLIIRRLMRYCNGTLVFAPCLSPGGESIDLTVCQTILSYCFMHYWSDSADQPTTHDRLWNRSMYIVVNM